MQAVWLRFLIVLVASMVAAPRPSNARESSEPFTITISAPERVQVGNPVNVSIHLTNTSDHDMLGSVSYGNGVWLAFHYSVTRIDGGTPRPLRPHFPGVLVGSAVGPSRTQPGKSQYGTSLLDGVFDMPVGEYSVQVSRNVLDASGHPTGNVVKSNTIRITMVPPPFAIEISTPSLKVKAGAPVPVTIWVTNASNGDLTFGAPPEGASVDPNFGYICEMEGAGDVSKSFMAMADPPTYTLKHGGTHEQKLDITSACNLAHPGTYRIQVVRNDPGDPAKGAVYSNRITLRVNP